MTEGKRSYSAIKLVGDGSFGTVWLCDWSSPVPPSTTLSAMQCGAGARAEWVGKRLVAVKRMKRVWKGGWEEASRLGELVVGPARARLTLTSLIGPTLAVPPRHSLASRHHPPVRRIRPA